MYLDAACRDEAEDFVAVNRVAAFGEGVFHARQVLVDDQDVFGGGDFLGLRGGAELLGAADGRLGGLGFAADEVEVFVDDGVGVEALLAEVEVEISYCLITLALDVTHEGRLIHLDFTVLEAALEHLLGIVRRLGSLLAQGLLDADASLGGNDEVEPVLLGRLRGRGNNLDRVAIMQYIFNRYVAAVHAGGDTAAAELRVDGEGEVEDCRALGQLDEFARRGEDVDFVLVEVHLEVLHEVER